MFYENVYPADIQRCMYLVLIFKKVMIYLLYITLLWQTHQAFMGLYDLGSMSHRFILKGIAS